MTKRFVFWEWRRSEECACVHTCVHVWCVHMCDSVCVCVCAHGTVCVHVCDCLCMCVQLGLPLQEKPVCLKAPRAGRVKVSPKGCSGPLGRGELPPPSSREVDCLQGGACVGTPGRTALCPGTEPGRLPLPVSLHLPPLPLSCLARKPWLGARRGGEPMSVVSLGLYFFSVWTGGALRRRRTQQMP